MSVGVPMGNASAARGDATTTSVVINSPMAVSQKIR
jgi:hypothetical protein